MDAERARGALAEVAARPGVPKPDPVLVVDGVHRQFGGVVAVDVEHLEIQRGAITALIGPNGAGKTTLFNLLTGFDRADRGRWTLDGEPVESLPAHAVARRGMVRTFQLTKALARMTLLENVLLAGREQRGERFLASMFRPLWLAQERALEARALDLLATVDLVDRRDERAGTLSGGQRKLLELARALMVEPRVVMLDEPMAGVNPTLAERLLEHVVGLRDDGHTLVFVEHDMDVVQSISDWVVVLAEGRVVAEGTPSAVAADPVVIDAYLGAHHGGARS